MLVFFRGVILAYLIATGIVVLNYKLTEDPTESNWRLFFDFTLISGALVLLYFLITFVGRMHNRIELKHVSNAIL